MMGIDCAFSNANSNLHSIVTIQRTGLQSSKDSAYLLSRFDVKYARKQAVEIMGFFSTLKKNITPNVNTLKIDFWEEMQN